MEKTFNYPQYEDYLQLAYKLAKKRRKIFQSILFFILVVIISYFLSPALNKLFQNYSSDLNQAELYFSLATSFFVVFVILFLRTLPFGSPSRKTNFKSLNKVFKREKLSHFNYVKRLEDNLASLRSQIGIKELALERAKEKQADFLRIMKSSGR